MTETTNAAKDALDKLYQRLIKKSDESPGALEIINEWKATVEQALETIAKERVGDDFNAVCRGRIEMLISLGFTHKFEGGFHVVEGHGFSYKHVGLLNLGDRIKHHLENRPATPASEMKEGLIATQYMIDPNDHHGIKIEWRGSGKWAISNGSAVMNNLGEWEYEPLPSNRDGDFIARTRFNTPSEALAMINAASKEGEA